MIVSLLLICVVMLSVGATFAADEDATLTTVDDEITVDEDVLSVEDETDTLEVEDEQVLESDDTTEVVSASATVTNNTFHNYFDETGNLTSDADELIFEGDFTGINVKSITIEKSVKLTGNNAVFNNVSFVIDADNVVIDGFKLYMDNSDDNSDFVLICVGDATNVTISNNVLDYKGSENMDSYGILANNVDNLKLISNTITYVGNTAGSYNNAIFIYGDGKKSTNIQVEGNVFNISLPSVKIGYDDNYNAYSYSDGVVFLNSEDITFKGNELTLNYNNVLGSSDTIHVLTFGNPNWDMDDDYEIFYPNTCKNVKIIDNKIIANGHTLIYGVFMAAENFEISDNTFDISSDINYATALDIEGPSSNGTVDNNIISLAAPNYAYGVYSYEYMSQITNITYSNNVIMANAYASCGMEIVNDYVIIKDNVFSILGNHTTGIVANMKEYGIITGNIIGSLGTNCGTAGTGDPMLHVESVAISVNGDTLISGNDLTSTSIGINLADYGDAGNIVVDGNNITVTANNDTVANYAIYSKGMDALNITNNKITFEGKSNGTTDSNAISVTGVDDVIISNNTIDATLTAGQGSAINMVNCPDATISENTIDFGYEGYVGYGYNNVIYIGFGADNAKISNNEISALGANVYGISIYGQNFTIDSNDVVIASDVYYACGINPDGGASGVIDKNNVSVTGTSAYGIYSGMWSAESPLIVNYTNNDIYANGFLAVGIEIGGAKENIVYNNILVEGNFTTGVVLYKYAQNTVNSTIIGNTIVSNGNSVGNASATGDKYASETTGINVWFGNLTISNNDVRTAGDYAINLNGINATLDDNYLAAKKTVGANAVENAENGKISGSGPELKSILSAVDLYAVYGDGVYYVTLNDENGDPIKNATIFISVDADMVNATTNQYGVAAFLVDEWNAGEYSIEVSYKGNDTYGPKSIKGYISIQKRVSAITAPANVNVLVTAIKNGYTYTLTLKDDLGNGLAKETVVITFNGKTETVTTDDLGVIKYKLVATKAGTQKLTVKFDSNENYVESTLTATVKINKEATKLTAAKKTFKAKVKTKKYTVTVKDSKGKAIKGLKVTLKVKGKTYKATTNAKGKATFKIKNLKKKGKYTAKVNFAGNNLYNKAAKSVKITVKK